METPNFTLTFHDETTEKYPNGYWYAYSDIMEIDADGPDPLTTVSTLTLEMEKHWKNHVCD